MDRYSQGLQKAIDSTRAMGFQVSDFPTDVEPLLTAQVYEMLHHGVAEFLGDMELSVEEVGLRCAPIHVALKPVVDEALGCSTLLTLGAVQFDDDVFFSPATMDIDALAHAGDYHVWLTLPSCEVIDLTLTSALYLKKGLDRSAAGVPLMMHAESQPRMRWSPLLVGDNVLERLLSPFL